MKEDTFTADELAAAWLEATVVDVPNAFSLAELADRWQCSDTTARKRLRHLYALGLVRHIKVKRYRINGVLSLTDAYEWIGDRRGDDAIPYPTYQPDHAD